MSNQATVWLCAMGVVAAAGWTGCVTWAATVDSSPGSKPVATAAGLLQGTENNGVTRYLGVRYAAAPVGDLRWRAPRATPHWQGIRVADHFGRACTQDRSPEDPRRDPRTGEDCLYLNVWTPADGRTAKRPVMVWVHGGAFEHDTGSGPAYDGASLAKRGVVVVTLNYRLGKFGFFAHPALTLENPGGPLGNYGLLDQIAALKWVKRNIGAFGGDPLNVTLFGCSAGGVSVSYLMTSPLAKDLFQKVIIESGILFDGPPGAPKTLQQLEANGVAAAKAWGVSSADAAALRQVPTDQVFASALPGSRGLVTWPILDGKVVPEDLRAAFEAGHIAHGPLLLGTNSYEAGFFALRQAAEGLSRRFAAQWPKVQQLYDGYGTHQTAGIEAELATDVLFTVSTRRAARAAAAHGVTTYLYRFSYLRPLQEGQVFGAIHGDEVYAVFGTMGLVEPHTSVGTRHIIEEIQSRWVQFATAGRPTEDPSRWPRFKLSAERLQDFTNAGPLVRTDYARARLDLAAELMAATPSP